MPLFTNGSILGKKGIKKDKERKKTRGSEYVSYRDPFYVDGSGGGNTKTGFQAETASPSIHPTSDQNICLVVAVVMRHNRNMRTHVFLPFRSIFFRGRHRIMNGSKGVEAWWLFDVRCCVRCGGAARNGNSGIGQKQTGDDRLSRCLSHGRTHTAIVAVINASWWNYRTG